MTIQKQVVKERLLWGALTLAYAPTTLLLCTARVVLS